MDLAGRQQLSGEATNETVLGTFARQRLKPRTEYGLDCLICLAAQRSEAHPHPTLYTLHPTPYTLHPTPFTLLHESIWADHWCAGCFRFPSSRLQGFLAHKKIATPQDPTVGIYAGPYGGPGGGLVSYERGTPVGFDFAQFGRTPRPLVGRIL